ncbi:hypothetical protein [Hyphomonas sp.]|uniref:hypothetical protein n=1 Tax=Hyphomonas sp. TaxID=87 RepID=UPI003299730D
MRPSYLPPLGLRLWAAIAPSRRAEHHGRRQAESAMRAATPDWRVLIACPHNEKGGG